MYVCVVVGDWVRFLSSFFSSLLLFLASHIHHITSISIHIEPNNHWLISYIHLPLLNRSFTQHSRDLFSLSLSLLLFHLLSSLLTHTHSFIWHNIKNTEKNPLQRPHTLFDLSFFFLHSRLLSPQANNQHKRTSLELAQHSIDRLTSTTKHKAASCLAHLADTYFSHTQSDG